MSDIQRMISRSQILRHTRDSTSIAVTFMSGFGEITSICGSAPSNAEVWIKVETVEKP